MLTPNQAQTLVKGTLQTKVPTLYRELQHHGTLDLFIAELAQEMGEFVAAQLDRVRSRTVQDLHLDDWQAVQDLTAAQRSVEEEAIATYLEFPPETTLPHEHLQAWCEPFAPCACVRG
jgi:hypothetical protein